MQKETIDSDDLFFKFPSTPYLIAPSSPTTHQDRILTNQEAQSFFSESVVVEEKIDGANLGISFSLDGTIQLQNRGSLICEPYAGQWRPMSNWLQYKKESLFDVLYNRYILFGEWCYYTHSVYYSSLPDWFIAFDVFDKESREFLSVSKRDTFIAQIELATVPHLYTGHISKESLDSFIGKSAYGNETIEGLYFRIDSSDFLRKRAKYVRKQFTQSIETHWSKKPIRKNQLSLQQQSGKK